MDEYFVEKILSKKRVKGKILYQVRWENYSEEHDTWEPAENLSNCKNMIEEFEKREEEKREIQKHEVEESLNKKRKRNLPTASKSSQVRAALEQRESKKKKVTEISEVSTEPKKISTVNFSGIAKLLAEDDSPIVKPLSDQEEKEINRVELQEDKENSITQKKDKKNGAEKLARRTLLNSISSDGELLTERQKERLMSKSTENVGITTYTDVDEKSQHLIPEITTVTNFKSDSLQFDDYSLDSSSLQCAPSFNSTNGDEYVQSIRNLQPNQEVFAMLTEKQLMDIQKKVVVILQDVTTSLEKLYN